MAVAVVSMQHEVGASLRRFRKARGDKLTTTARRAGVSFGHLCEIERGEKKPCSETLAAVCCAMELPMSVLLRDAADEIERKEVLA